MEAKAQVKLVCQPCRGCTFWILSSTLSTRKNLHCNQVTGTELHPSAQTTQTDTLCQWHSPHYAHSRHYTHIAGLCNGSRWQGVSVSQAACLKFHTPDSHTYMRLHTADCTMVLLLVCLHVFRSPSLLDRISLSLFVSSKCGLMSYKRLRGKKGKSISEENGQF